MGQSAPVTAQQAPVHNNPATGYAKSYSSTAPPQSVNMGLYQQQQNSGLNPNAPAFQPTQVHTLPVVGHNAHAQQQQPAAGYWNPAASSQNEVVNAANWTYGQPQAQNWYQ